MVALAEIFTRYGPDYLATYGSNILPSHRRAVTDILRCRTAALGGQVYHCRSCGHTHYVYHSCRNRSCPQCHYPQSRTWRDARCRELLNAPYFHVVFTVPDGLNDAMRSNQAQLYGLLMKAAATSLIELANDPHYVGGTVGVLAVLHTWGRTLTYHPHVHCLVTGGGLHRPTMEWREARPDFLVPVRALSVLFRRRLRALLGATLDHLDIPASVWNVPWVVHCEPVDGEPDSVLKYLAGYVYRTAISEDRIQSADNGRVAFRYKDTRDDHFKTMTLPAEEFIRRFLQHVLPAGFHKVRYYGLWAPGNRAWLRRIQLLLGSGAPDDLSSCEAEIPPERAATPAGPPLGHTCPACGKPSLVWVGRLKRRSRDPPSGASP